jgi:hypothetical protein
MRQVIKKRLTCSPSEAVLGEGLDSVKPVLDQGSSARSVPTPGVRLVHVDGQVQAVEVTCRCGDVSVIELEYEQ